MVEGQKNNQEASLLIETTFRGNASLPCVYMEESVMDVLPTYLERVNYRKVVVSSEQGKKRFLELSCALFGEEGVYKYHRLAPLPALFIDGELCFDAIPTKDELVSVIDARLDKKMAATPKVNAHDDPKEV